MKKTAVSIVFAILSAWLAVPLAPLTAAAAHSCCRAHGEHHCSNSETPVYGEHAISASCPHRGVAAVVTTVAVVAAHLRVAGDQGTSEIPIIATVQAGVPSQVVSHERAPPALLLV